MTATEQQIRMVKAELEGIRRLKKMKERLEREQARMDVADCEPSDDVNRIIDAASEVFEIRRNIMLSRLRIDAVVIARQSAMALAYELGYGSLPSLGMMFRRDHGTILNAIRAVEARADTDPHFAAKLAKLREKVTGTK